MPLDINDKSGGLEAEQRSFGEDYSQLSLSSSCIRLFFPVFFFFFPKIKKKKN